VVWCSTGDALSVCFNTVAILFLAEVDNIIFQVALPEEVRARVEEAGRVVLGDADQLALARTKPVHIALIMAAVLGGVALGAEGIAFPLLVFWCGRMFQSCDTRGGPLVRGTPGCDVCVRLGKTTWACCCGLCGVGIFALFAHMA
jgi:hypothetical protein